MVLHTVNKSPLSHASLSACLKVLGDRDSILLIEDGVYGALNLAENRSMLVSELNNGSVFALQEDVQARGIAPRLLEGITLVDYNGFVDLVIKHQSSMSWL